MHSSEPERRPTAIVTGAASGIGLATVAHLRRDGWRAIGIDRHGEAGEDHVTGDVGDERVLGEALERAGEALDGLVCSAGLPPAAPWNDLGAFDEILRVNLRAPYLAVRSALPALRNAGGSVVLVGSIVGAFEGSPRSPAYAATKAGIEGLARSLALIAAPEVRVNVLAAGGIDTPFDEFAFPPSDRPDVPLGRMGTADEVARVIGLLLSSATSYVTGAVWRVDGGRAVLSGPDAIARAAKR
jgi:meso-butanediol dehydrogenase/(S,S)-butanediol dehydrogenase/diacetyl reductase